MKTEKQDHLQPEIVDYFLENPKGLSEILAKNRFIIPTTIAVRAGLIGNC